MSPLRLIIPTLATALLGSCQSIRQHRLEREIASEATNGGYSFRVFPGCTDTYSLTLAGVTKTSEALGPDFSVHYFTIGDDRSISFYHGAHPRTEDTPSIASFASPVGRQKATWRLYQITNGVKATTYVDATEGREGPPYLWHIIIVAPDSGAARQLAEAVESFRMTNP